MESTLHVKRIIYGKEQSAFTLKIDSQALRRPFIYHKNFYSVLFNKAEDWNQKAELEGWKLKAEKLMAEICFF